MDNPNKSNFIINFTNVLEDLYDNNYDYTVFNMYFIINPLSFNLTGHIDLIKLIEHLNKYPIEYIRDENNITKFYKNIGFINALKILLFLSIYDINNLTKMSININSEFYRNIKIINEKVNKDLGNTIINYDTKINPNSELILLIYADFTSMPHDNKFN
jgi:hypothetical protein